MSAQLEIRAPADQTEGTRSQVLRWLKGIGDRVTENEPLIEIETDKVTVEIAAPGSGTLREILRQEQEEIAPGDLLGRIDTGEAALGHADAVPASAPGSAQAGSASAPAASAARSGSVGSSMSVGQVAPAGSSAPAPSPAAATPDGVAAERRAANSLSPAVRRLLSERGLTSADVAGTGQGGRITVEDVLRLSGQSASAPATPSALSSPAPSHAAASQPAAAASAPSPDITGPRRMVPHTAVRKRIAEHMVQSLLHTAPHVTTVFDANLSAVLEHRQKHRDEFARRGAPLTLTAYFLRATVAAIRAVPEANSRWTDSALEMFDSVHVGVATALESGLVVPVLRDAQSRDLFETAQGLDDLVTRARAGRLTPADMRGGTFTISNHGVSGSLVATPIVINQPQSAILGVGKLEKRVVAITAADGESDRVVVQPRCYVTLTIDHRVMDGHQANRFLQTFVNWLESSPA
ncbi:MAG TPA: dihydrolipoamide acetyltransferase family protein [Steroidobacteraceae bacterium]|nr:dihydrolipoamide acetyltransferase family protein [Steroidobacteraceae bacterium]